MQWIDWFYRVNRLILSSESTDFIEWIDWFYRVNRLIYCVISALFTASYQPCLLRHISLVYCVISALFTASYQPCLSRSPIGLLTSQRDALFNEFSCGKLALILLAPLAFLPQCGKKHKNSVSKALPCDKTRAFFDSRNERTRKADAAARSGCAFQSCFFHWFLSENSLRWTQHF